jgi:excisionase family DNA binding protein
VTDHLDMLTRLSELLERHEARWPRWLSVDLAAEYCSSSPSTIRRAIRSGRISAHRLCRGKILVDRLELDAVLTAATGYLRAGRGLAARRRKTPNENVVQSNGR